MTPPYDWADGIETIEVEYVLPKLTPDEVAAHGNRTYFGYVAELYYGDVLQDYVAHPRKLGRLGATPEEQPQTYPGSGLFPQPE